MALEMMATVNGWWWWGVGFWSALLQTGEEIVKARCSEDWAPKNRDSSSANSLCPCCCV